MSLRSSRKQKAASFDSLKHRRSGKTIEKIMEECKQRRTNLAELKSGSIRRQVSETRGIIAVRSRDELELSAAEIARHLGVNTSSITRAIERTEQWAKTNKHN